MCGDLESIRILNRPFDFVLLVKCTQFGPIVTDDGTCFVSVEIEAFFTSDGIEHLTSAPYHPVPNVFAECAVQIVKKGLKKITQGSIHTCLTQVLFKYILTP